MNLKNEFFKFVSIRNVMNLKLICISLIVQQIYFSNIMS